jgi:hypothetical protein
MTGGADDERVTTGCIGEFRIEFLDRHEMRS